MNLSIITRFWSLTKNWLIHDKSEFQIISSMKYKCYLMDAKQDFTCNLSEYCHIVNFEFTPVVIL